MAHMLGSYHLIATKTVQPTLKSARDFCSRMRAPQILHSGDFEACYKRAEEILFSSSLMSKPELVLNGLPVRITTDWTYHIVASPAPKW